ncbi:LysR substrate-binding domain-containing protein [Oceaniglobus indicus]|uniref:LysR substrate-binding domain-containing protein n=1 Tax=Oceaniglobus indicus TaxID=2047749 RepID=UPI000C18FC17|nr:LysR substrate-binding domain-containing protein [Oceaniglobus indicus]
MDGLTLRQLRYFDALARHRQFGHAAEACAISQPALSVQIARLEDILGHKLFERDSRQVRLTALGADMVERVRDILRAVDGLKELAAMAEDGRSTRLRLGVIPTIAPYLLPALLARLRASDAGVDIHVRETLTSRLVQELDEGRIDAAIVALPVGQAGLIETHLFDEPLLLVRHAEVEANPVPRAEHLVNMRLLLLEDGHCFRDRALSFCNIAASGRRGELDGSSLSTLVQMVGAGVGATLIPQMAVPIEVRSAPVCAVRFAAPEPVRAIGLIRRNATVLTAQLEELVEAVRAVGVECAEQADAILRQRSV